MSLLLVVDVDGTFEERLVHIMYRWNRVLQGKTVKLVKVWWQHQGVKEATWEDEDTVRSNYLFLFEDEGIFLVIW